MLLQGDKPNTTLTRERASRVLFEGDDQDLQDTPSNTFVNFAFDHNTEEFQQLVKAKYPQTVQPSEPKQEDIAFNKYHTVDTPYEAPSGTVQKYYNDSNPIPFGFEQSETYKASMPKPQAYQSFRPKVLMDFEDLQIDRSERSEIDEALLQKIDEVQIYETKETFKKDEIATAIDRETATESYIKLNTKGIIACVTFIAVTLLIVLLVIVNSIAIGGASTKIKRLRDENTQLQQSYMIAETAMQKAYKIGEEAAYLFAKSQGVTPPIRITLPPISSYQLAPANPDTSTNFFDQIAKFFSSIFA